MSRKKLRAKQKRAPRGTGSVFEDARRGGWVCRVPVGRDKNRRLTYREFRAPTQEGALAKAKGARPPDATVTLADWSARWLKALACRDKTRAIYGVHLRCRVVPSLGHLTVARLTAYDIESAVASWTSGPKAVGLRTARGALVMLSGCLSAATRAGIIDRNPARLVRRPRPADPPHDPFTRAELRAVIDRALTDHRLHSVALCAGTGMRIGEALGVQRGDYDPATGVLHIRRTALRGGTFGPPKSKYSTRKILVPVEVRAALAKPVQTTCYDTIESRWRKMLKAMGLRHRGLHQLRHSVISHALVATKNDVAEVARYAGDSPAVVMAVYCHPTGADVSGAISGLLGGAEVAPKGENAGKTRRKRP